MSTAGPRRAQTSRSALDTWLDNRAVGFSPPSCSRRPGWACMTAPSPGAREIEKNRHKAYRFSTISNLRLYCTTKCHPCPRDEVQPYPRVFLIPPNRPGLGRSGSIVAVPWAPFAIQETRNRCHYGSSSSCDRAWVPDSSKLRASGRSRGSRRGSERERQAGRAGFEEEIEDALGPRQ